jgi:hypothetical protein
VKEYMDGGICDTSHRCPVYIGGFFKGIIEFNEKGDMTNFTSHPTIRIIGIHANPFKKAFFMNILHSPRTEAGTNERAFLFQANTTRHTDSESRT